MNKLLFYCTMLLPYISVFPQSSIQDLIDDLYSDEIYISIPATYEIMRSDITEAFEHLDVLYESKPPIVQSAFLMALQQFDDPMLSNRLYDYIDRADNFSNEEYPLDPLREKALATYLLFLIEDYQTYNYILDLIYRDGFNNLNPIAFKSLDILINSVSEAENEAKFILIDIWDNSADDHYRYFSMLALCEKYGTEMQSRIISSFLNDDDLPIRILALEYLFSQNYSELNSLLKQKLSLDPEWSFRVDIADSLLEKFGEPSDLKAVIDYQPTEPDETAKSLMLYSINNFIPPKPDTLDYYGLANRLITYTDELLQYGWISTEIVRAFYETKLNDIIEAVQGGKYGKACNIINNTLLPTIEQHLNNSNITTEGYKYLHYYTIYIKEEIEAQYGACP